MRTEATATIRARPSAVWGLVHDPTRYTEWMRAITHFDRVDHDGDVGCGARYSMRMQVGSVEIGGVVELVEYDPCQDVAWHSVSGIDQRGRLRLRETEPGLTTVTFRVSYQSPGGLWGLVADQVSGMAVRRNLRDSLVSLRERCEARSAGDGATDRGPIDLARGQLSAARVLAEARVLRPSRPDRMLAALLALHRWGLTVPGGFSASAARYPDDVFVVDDAGTYTFAAIDRRTNALVNALHAAGVGEGSRAGILCRNHAWFVESLVALTKLGADVVLLNTDYAGPQLRDVLERERVNVIVHDAEYGATLTKVRPSMRRFVAWTDAKRPGTRTLQRLTEGTPIAEPDPPEQPSRITILTSGTTGTPKGASRSQPHSADPIVGTLSRMPLRSRETTLIAVPLFHAWGLAQFGLGLVLSSTLVLHRRFDPEAVLASIERHHVTGLIAVPMMLRRILDLPRQTRRRYDTSSLRVVAVSGSALPAELATSFMDEYGDILYNLYGSTEVAAATIATPEDMRRAPGTAGRPPYATVVRLLDEQGRDVPQGSVGRIFVGNDMLFEGYTDADGADTMHGLMSTGDLGRMDADGRLFVEGRSDDMIVSGGENVFPAEVEELLQAHPHVADAAVIGVPDEEWGGRLRAYVVKRRGARLTVDDLKGHVRGHLARYKVPRDIVFVSSLPRNPAGKVLKAALRDAKTSPA